MTPSSVRQWGACFLIPPRRGGCRRRRRVGRPTAIEDRKTIEDAEAASALAAESPRVMTATARGRGEMVDATDLSQNLSALAETRDAELLKVGETCHMAIPSQALWPKG